VHTDSGVHNDPAWPIASRRGLAARFAACGLPCRSAFLRPPIVFVLTKPECMRRSSRKMPSSAKLFSLPSFRAALAWRSSDASRWPTTRFSMSATAVAMRPSTHASSTVVVPRQIIRDLCSVSFSMTNVARIQAW